MESTEDNNDDYQFEGCLACLNDGMSVRMQYISYALCIVLIGIAIGMYYMLPLTYSIPFVVLTAGFVISWIIFLKLYASENP